jgi:hypothetical protein
MNAQQKSLAPSIVWTRKGSKHYGSYGEHTAIIDEGGFMCHISIDGKHHGGASSVRLTKQMFEQFITKTLSQ